MLARPFFFFAAAFAIVWAIVRNRKSVTVARWVQAGVWTAWAALAIVFAASILSCLQPAMHGYMGSTILAIAAGFPRGLPMYHPRNAPAVYALPYGPYAYLLYTPVIELYPRLVAVRVYISLANIGCFVAMYFVLRRYASRAIALVLLSIMTSILIATQWTFFSMNADIWLFLFTSIGLLCADAERRWWHAVVLGICAGLLLDLKISVLALVALLMIRQFARQGWRPVLLSSGVATVVVALPFCSPTISLRDYAAWITGNGHRAVVPELLGNSALCLLFFYAPPLLMLVLGRSPSEAMPGREGVSTRFSRSNLLAWAYGAALLAATLLFTAAASQAGGGYWHFWPLLPFILLWTAQLAATPSIAPSVTGNPPLLTASILTPRSAMTLAALCLAGLLIALRYSPRSFQALAANTSAAGIRQERQTEDELQALGHQFPTQPMAMAPGLYLDSQETQLRFELVHQNGVYIADTLAMAGLQSFGAPPTLPDASPALLRHPVDDPARRHSLLDPQPQRQPALPLPRRSPPRFPCHPPGPCFRQVLRCVGMREARCLSRWIPLPTRPCRPSSRRANSPAATDLSAARRTRSIPPRSTFPPARSSPSSATTAQAKPPSSSC